MRVLPGSARPLSAPESLPDVRNFFRTRSLLQSRRCWSLPRLRDAAICNSVTGTESQPAVRTSPDSCSSCDSRESCSAPAFTMTFAVAIVMAGHPSPGFARLGRIAPVELRSVPGPRLRIASPAYRLSRIAYAGNTHDVVAVAGRQVHSKLLSSFPCLHRSFSWTFLRRSRIPLRRALPDLVSRTRIAADKLNHIAAISLAELRNSCIAAIASRLASEVVTSLRRLRPVATSCIAAGRCACVDLARQALAICVTSSSSRFALALRTTIENCFSTCSASPFASRRSAVATGLIRPACLTGIASGSVRLRRFPCAETPGLWRAWHASSAASSATPELTHQDKIGRAHV